MEIIVIAFVSISVLSVALGGSLYDIGTGPFCSASPQDCTDNGDTFVEYFSDSCWTGNKVWCRRRETVPGQQWIGGAPLCDTQPSDCVLRFMDHVATARCGDGSCCVSGNKQLCVPRKAVALNSRLGGGRGRMGGLELEISEKPRLKVWLGTSPFCKGKCKDCALFGMECMGRDKSGDGGTCLTGKKALCVVPEPPPLWAPAPSNVLKVLSYNVRELGYMYTHDGQRERTCQIPRQIVEQLGDVDVVVLQEVFMGGCFPDKVSLADLMQYHGFPFITSKVGDRDSGVIEDGGVYIASRWYIQEEHEFIFEATHYGEADAFAAKGSIYAKIIKSVSGVEAVYHIIGTHMQAQIGKSRDNVRAAQAKEMRDFMHKQNIPYHEPVIYAGDFNCDIIANPKHVRKVLNNLGAGIPQRVGDVHTTFDADNNDLFKFKDKRYVPEWLDYVVFSKDKVKPLVATLEAVKLRAKKSFPVCRSGPLKPGYIFAHSPVCAKRRRIRDLSDHYPVLGMFMFP